MFRKSLSALLICVLVFSSSILATASENKQEKIHDKTYIELTKAEGQLLE